MQETTRFKRTVRAVRVVEPTCAWSDVEVMDWLKWIESTGETPERLMFHAFHDHMKGADRRVCERAIFLAGRFEAWHEGIDAREAKQHAREARRLHSPRSRFRLVPSDATLGVA